MWESALLILSLAVAQPGPEGVSPLDSAKLSEADRKKQAADIQILLQQMSSDNGFAEREPAMKQLMEIGLGTSFFFWNWGRKANQRGIC